MGDNPDENIFMSWTDPNPHENLNYIAFKTGWGAEG